MSEIGFSTGAVRTLTRGCSTAETRSALSAFCPCPCADRPQSAPWSCVKSADFIGGKWEELVLLPPMKGLKTCADRLYQAIILSAADRVLWIRNLARFFRVRPDSEGHAHEVD